MMTCCTMNVNYKQKSRLVKGMEASNVERIIMVLHIFKRSSDHRFNLMNYKHLTETRIFWSVFRLFCIHISICHCLVRIAHMCVCVHSCYLIRIYAWHILVVEICRFWKHITISRVNDIFITLCLLLICVCVCVKMSAEKK